LHLYIISDEVKQLIIGSYQFGNFFSQLGRSVWFKSAFLVR